LNQTTGTTPANICRWSNATAMRTTGSSTSSHYEMNITHRFSCYTTTT
jgi:hypothetical protein